MLKNIGTLVDSASGVTATRTSTGVLVDGQAKLFRASVTLNSGTSPTLNITIQHAPYDDTDLYTDLVSFEADIAASGEYEVQVPSATMVCFPYVRAVSTLAGTSPNYDFNIKAFS